jgi:hypothetical protein
MDDETEEIPRDVVFSTLSNRRRRLAIRYLRTVDEPVSVRDLSRRLAAWENEVDEDELTYKQRKRAYTSLHQTHLPKLDDGEFVTYDRDRGTVIVEDRARALYPYLDPPSPAPRWTRYYLAVGIAALVVVSAAALGVPAFRRVPGLAYATVVAVAVLAIASVEAYTQLADDDGSALPPDLER